MSADLKHLFVSPELSIKLRDNGFNEPCIATWDADDMTVIYYGHSRDFEDIPAPIYQQVVDWLRLKHGLVITHDMCEKTCSYNPIEKYHKFNLYKVDNRKSINALSYFGEHSSFDTYYEAFNFTIEEALSLI